jgi:hypothetical protein
MNMGTIAHYELRTTVEFIAVFLAHIMPQIHDILFVFSVLVETKFYDGNWDTKTI